jgi:hypothetical protein
MAVGSPASHHSVVDSVLLHPLEEDLVLLHHSAVDLVLLHPLEEDLVLLHHSVVDSVSAIYLQVFLDYD